MTRAVLDTGVLVAAAISPRGVPAGCLKALADGRFELVVSELLLGELERVLLRAKFRAYLTTDHARGFVEAVRSEGLVLSDPPTPQRVSADPDDDYLVALARSAQAHVLVASDAHLHELNLKDLLVLSPREFLERLPA